MAKLPTVAIIGRPNTGKSRLFNRIVGRRKAIVSDVPGTTRDHIAGRVEGKQVDYLLVDTGGMGGGTADSDLEDDVHAQSLLALEKADIILCTINSQEELTGSDYEITELLRKHKKKHVPIIVVLTKCDNPTEVDELLPQYYELGISDTIIPISAIHKFGLDDLTSTVEQYLVDLHFEKQVNESGATPRIAMIGKPNVGKSSLINALMSEGQREASPLLVSDIPGTTRDSTDTYVRYHDAEYNFIDTAGIKRRKSTDEGIETYAYFRSIQSLQECDIAVLALDANESISRQEKRIAGMAVEEGKGLILLMNKTDLLTTEQREQKRMELLRELPFCRFAPVLFCSAKTRKGILGLFDQIEAVHRNRLRRIPTKQLQDWYKDTVYDQPMSSLQTGKHITQSEGVPPTFVLFVKDPKMVQVSQLRYLDNRLRELYAFEGVPVRWITKAGKG